MAHLIENNEIAYVGRTPWHGLGYKMPDGATGAEMLKAAHLDWNVDMREITFMLPGTTGELVEPLAGFRAATRSDTDRVFTVATPSYHPVQNAQIVDFFAHFCEAGHATMETVGALKGGAIVWALAKLSEAKRKVLLGDDVLEGYILLATAHDTTMQTIGRATQIRGVCWNTISAALRDHKGSHTQFRMSHLREWTKEVADEARATIGMAIEAIDHTNDVMEELSKVTIDDKGWVDFMNRLMGTENVKDKKGILKPAAAEIFHATITSPGANLRSAKDTLYGAVNGVTYYVDHVRGRTDESRLRGAFFGEGERFKNMALEVAMEMAGVHA